MDSGSLWHKDAIAGDIEPVIRAVRRSSIASFYLAGGTALALRLGHRISRDLDFFSNQPFDEERLIAELKDIETISVIAKGRETLHLHIAGIKVSLLGYPYPVLFPFAHFLGMQVADPRDIACMKIAAIAGRGSRRDFVDLHAIAEMYGLSHLLDLFKKKYAQANYNLLHLLKSLTYFADAEKEPMPDMRLSITWDQVTEFFRRETPKLI